MEGLSGDPYQVIMGAVIFSIVNPLLLLMEEKKIMRNIDKSIDKIDKYKLLPRINGDHEDHDEYEEN